MKANPSPNGSNGARDAQGRFANGNPGGPGNPYARKVAQYHQAFLRAVTAKDMKAIVRALVDKAKAGDVLAVREVLNRTLGKEVDVNLVEMTLAKPTKAEMDKDEICRMFVESLPVEDKKSLLEWLRQKRMAAQRDFDETNPE